MNFDPQKFFIGMIDFFSIILPGALMTYLAREVIGPLVFGVGYPPPPGVAAWLMFLFSSYLLGHFIFLLGSLLDKLYDRIRRATNWQQGERAKEGKRHAFPFEKWIAKWWFRKDPDLALRSVLALKEEAVGTIDDKSPINAFQWAKARLTIEQPAAVTVVQRFEADSKFFRSLVVVLAGFAIWKIRAGDPQVVWTSVLLMFLAFWRYVDQRFKSTQQAYWYLITLAGKPKPDLGNRR